MLATHCHLSKLLSETTALNIGSQEARSTQEVDSTPTTISSWLQGPLAEAARVI